MELEGVEPSSKQGARRLSTCLAGISSFSTRPASGSQTRGPVPLFRHTVGTSGTAISPLMIPHCQRDRKRVAEGGVLVPAPALGAGIKRFYLVKLRSECIAIIAICCFECSDLRAPIQRSACLLSNSTCCQNRSAPSIEITGYKITNYQSLISPQR